MNALTKFNPFRTTDWDPFADLGAFENRLAKFFGRMPGNGDKETMNVNGWTPLVDIAEDEKEYLVTAELPDVKKEEVKVTVENGCLTLTGERKFEKEEKGKKYHRVERAYGTFMRSFTLPETVNGDKVVADFKDGVLKVHLPKDEKARPKAIDVKVT